MHPHFRSCVTRSLFAIALVCVRSAPAQAPDTIFFHGDILTGTRLKAGDTSTTPARVTAIAIRSGTIIAAGSDKQVLALKDTHTTSIDLHGAFAMPGFNDAHTHIAFAGQQRLTVDLDNVPSLSAMLAKIRSYAASLPPGAWIVGGGWDQTKWASRTLPTRQDLDAVTGDHPALLERTDGHIAVANSAALAVANINVGTPNPMGGQIDHDSNGDPTGIIREAPALALLQQKIPPPTTETRRKALELSIQDALSHGVTSIQDYSTWDDWLVLEELEHTGKLPLRISEWIDFNLPLAVLNERRASHPANDPLLHLAMLKAFMDGSLGSRTAAMNDSYTDQPGDMGLPRYDQDKLNQMSSDRAADGFQLGFHAIGDLANDMALNAFEAAEQVGRPADQPAPPTDPNAAIVTASPITPRPSDFRFRIEHAQVVSPGAFDRFAQLGVIASMQPSHLLTDMTWAAERLGPDRSRRAYAWKSFLDHGVVVAFGTDYPVESISPFRGLYAAITRQNVQGTQTFEPQEKLTINQAIYAYTQASAFAEFREHLKGRLEPGYLADIVVLDRDITRAAPQDLLRTKVLRTIVGGTTVYQAP
ncbi:MAG: amidohydrolase [Acidobacteria bacterium]|nr:amidohydrolase [Acidobacteriota bacterium]